MINERDWLFLDSENKWYDYEEGVKDIVCETKDNIVCGWMYLKPLPDWWSDEDE